MYKKIPLERLKDTPFQPRYNIAIDDPDIVQLAKSIEENGLIQSIKVSYDKTDGNYFVMFGHRRVMAYKRLGRKEIEALISETDAYSKESRFTALVENLQRENLNPVEVAKAYQDALDSGLTLSELSDKIGKSKSEISRSIKILTLNPKIHLYYAEHKEARRDETLLYELSNCVKDTTQQYEFFLMYQEGKIGRQELLRMVKTLKPRKSKEKMVDGDVKIAYDHQGIKLRASFLTSMDDAKKESFEKAIKEVVDQFRLT